MKMSDSIQIIKSTQAAVIRLRKVVDAFYKAAVEDLDDCELSFDCLMDAIALLLPSDEALIPVLDDVIQATTVAVVPATRSTLIEVNQSLRKVQDQICNLRSMTDALKISAKVDLGSGDLYWPHLMAALKCLVPDKDLLGSVVEAYEYIGFEEERPQTAARRATRTPAVAAGA
jgi:hypothetical protein